MLPIQNMTLLQAQAATIEQKTINRQMMKWNPEPYSQLPSKWPIYIRSMNTFFNSAEIMDIVDGTSVVPVLPANIAALPAAQRNLLNAQQSLFSAKSRGIMNLLELSFKNNTDGWTDREPCDPNDGLTAWQNLNAKHHENNLHENGSLRQTFMTLDQTGLTFQEFVSSIRLHRDACAIDPNEVVTDNDCRNTLKRGFIDPSDDGRIDLHIQHVYQTLTFDQLIAVIEKELRSYEKWTAKYVAEPMTSSTNLVNTNSRSTNSRNTNSSSSSSFETCPYCKRKGHGEDMCWTKHPESKPDWVKKREEKSKLKKTLKQNKSNNDIATLISTLQSQVSNPAPTSVSSSTALVTTKPATKHPRDDPFCLYCGKDGHWSAGCPDGKEALTHIAKQQKRMYDASARVQENSGGRIVQFVDDNDDIYDSANIVISYVVLSFYQRLPPKPGYLLVMLDSGTSCYICVERSAFKVLKPDPFHSLETADSAPHKSEGVGAVSFFTCVRLYSTIVCNLWSPGKMIEDGWALSFARNGDIVANHSNPNFSELIFKFSSSSKLWYGYLPLDNGTTSVSSM